MIKGLLLGIHLGKWNKKSIDLAWLILRVGIALLMLRHGYGKLVGFAEMSAQFPDPLGIGSSLSLIGTVATEFFASLFLIAGLLTRWAALSSFFTMLVAAFMIHGPDPFAKKELAILYGLVYLFLMLAGGGKYSLDNYLNKRFRKFFNS